MATSNISQRHNLGIDSLGVRLMLIVVFVCSIASYFNLLSEYAELKCSLQFLISSLSLGCIGFLLFFGSRMHIRIKVIYLALFASLMALSSLTVFSLMAPDRFFLLIAPILLALVIDHNWSYAYLAVVSVAYAITGAGFSFGWLNLPDLDIIDGAFYLPTDVFGIISISVVLIIIISRMQNKLVANVYRIYERNSKLLEDEKLLEDARRDLQVGVLERRSELEDTRSMLEEARDRLQEQNRIYTERQRVLEKTYAEIQAAQANLTQSSKLASLGALSLGIAHEINNPLNFIRGSLLIMERRQDISTDPAASKLLHIMKDATDHINRIVKGLNQFGNQGSESSEVCDIISITHDCRVMLHPQLCDGVNLTIHDPGLPFLVKGKAGKLHQLFLNLLHNAVQATPADGEIRVEFAGDSDTGLLKVSISDTGSGIPEDIMQRITEPFFTTKAIGVGTGLGLYICQQIVNEHNGKMTFRSKPGKGTVVDVELPAAGKSD